MENQNNLTSSLFRFVTLRMPELTGSSTASNSFVAQVAPEAGTMYGLVQSYGSLREAAGHFTPFASDEAMAAAAPGLLNFSEWLSGAGSSAPLAETSTRAAGVPALTPAAEAALWDNLFYQMATGSSDSQKEAILRMLAAHHLAVNVAGDSVTEEDLAVLRRAKVVIPKEIVAVAPETTTPATPPTFRGSKGLSDCLDILVAKDTARRYETAIGELTKIKKTYDKENAAALATARAAYDVTIKSIIDALPAPTDPTAPPTAPPDFPAFEFRPADEMKDSVLTAQLSPESLALLQSTQINAEPTFDEALQLLDKGLKAETATVFEKTQFYNTTVVMAGVQMPGAKSLPTERNGFMTKAFQVAPNTYKVAIALNAGGGTGSEVFAISHTGGSSHPLNFGNFESFEINGLSGVLVEVSGEDLLNAYGEIEFSAQLHLGNGAGAGINTQSPTGGSTSTGKTLEEPNDIYTWDPGSDSIPPPTPVPSSYGIHKLGVADYMRVEQTVCCYVPGEVSHIENIMAREYKERSTRRLRRSEDTTTSEKSSEKENQHDTSSADRFELQQEISKVIAENNSLAVGASAGAQGSLGKSTYHVDANANYATNLSTTNSSRSAQTYAKEVTDKAMERVLEKTREERISKIIDEYEEQNKHGFDNRGDNAEHISGVYRWVDKIYDNQIITYGKRLMYEFRIPQPADFYRAGVKSVEDSIAIITAPKDPRETGTIPLASHLVLNRTNYALWAAMYNAEVEAPPSDTIAVGKSFSYSGSSDKPDGHELYSAKEDIEIPDGYFTVDAYAAINGNWDRDGRVEHGIGVTVGNKSYTYNLLANNASTSNSFFPIPAYERAIPVTMYTYNHFAVGVSITLGLQLTTAAFEKWQRETFQAIISAYEKQLDIYNKNVAEAQANGAANAQANPLFYRIIENTVLKKNCLEYLVGHSYLGGQSFVIPGAINVTTPVASAAMDAYASVTAFMEQAFEWEIMSYNFYPFYWAAKSQWAALYGNENDDPLFRAFLQAGMARVVATVRPGFEDAVMYYMATGQVWNGGTVPIIGDKLYTSLINDLNTLGVKVGDKWETRVPTTLTVIQKSSVGLDAGGLPCNDDCDDIKYFFSSDKKLEPQSIAGDSGTVTIHPSTTTVTP